MKRELKLHTKGAVKVKNAKSMMLDLPFNFDPSKFLITHSIKSCWAKRIKRGHMYGVHYIHKYKDEIYKWFEIGRLDKSKTITWLNA